VSRTVTAQPASVPRPSALRQLWNAAVHVASRTRLGGAKSGWVALGTFADNASVKLRNRLGGRPRVVCPCCGWEGVVFRTLDFGHGTARNMICPGCGAHDRQRMFALFLERRGLPFLRSGARVLHSAPETQVRQVLDKARTGRVEIDVFAHTLTNSGHPRCALDLAFQPFAEDSFDGAILLHVFEHVEHDRKGFRELARTLRPGGTAVIMVPIYIGLTETDDWGWPDPLMFDHYRTYCVVDFAERAAPLEVEQVHPRDLLSPEEQARYAIRDTEVIFLCAAPGALHAAP